ncbi:MAG TPA: HAD-IA family hydrolase [Myxococcota bacterium]|nr:HAD-IA family hydrolase [Myxococcota bacterium]
MSAWSRVARLRVLSNHRTRWMSGHLSRFRLREHFERVVVSEAIGCAKPDIRAFELALTDAGVSPGEVLFVDDKQRNVLVARELGLQAVWADPTSRWLDEVEALLAIR